MTLAMPDDASRTAAYVCHRSDSLFSVMEKCLDNGLGTCLVVEDDHRLVGRLSLEDIRLALREGNTPVESTVGGHLAAVASRRKGLLPNAMDDQSSLQPVLDLAGRLTDVRIDRSTELVQISRPQMTHVELRHLLDAFLSGWISSKGPYVQKFEADFREFIGVRHGVAVSNGTTALHLALSALGIGPGDEVIVPDLTFAATINTVLHCGATPVIVDVDRRTWCMSREAMVAACTSRTKAVIPVHLYGRPAEIGPITAFASDHGIAVVEDCAEAHGARFDGRPVGQFGTVSCFSFYANKIVTTGEGGMCLTDCDEIASRMRRLRDHGMSPERAYWHDDVGFNYRITNLQAAIGESQLRRVDRTLARNAGLASRYCAALRGIPGIRFPPTLSDRCEPVVWLACVQVPMGKRSAVIQAAREAKIEMRPFFHPLSSMPPYARFAACCPNSLELGATGINLPTSDAVDDQVIDRVSRIFRDVLR